MHFCGLSSCLWTQMVVIIKKSHIFLCILIPFTVEKGRQKNPRSLCIQTQTSPDVLSSEKTLELAQYKTKCENQSGFILQLKQLLSCGNTKFEALTVVIQHLLSEVRMSALCLSHWGEGRQEGGSVHALVLGILSGWWMVWTGRIRPICFVTSLGTWVPL